MLRQAAGRKNAGAGGLMGVAEPVRCRDSGHILGVGVGDNLKSEARSLIFGLLGGSLNVKSQSSYFGTLNQRSEGEMRKTATDRRFLR